MKILGLAGQQGAGKDYVFEWLRDFAADSEFVVARAAFADGVRREVATEVVSALGVTIGDSDGMGTWSKPYTAGQRFLLQQYGTEFRRAQDADYWVQAGMRYMEEATIKPDLWVVTDMRFENEAQAIANAHGVTAEVVADPETRGRRLGLTAEEVAEQQKHASEVIDFPTHYQIDADRDGQAPYFPSALWKWLGI